jgi:hypothetical protein
MRGTVIFLTAIAFSCGELAAQNKLQAADEAFQRGDYGYAVNIYLGELKKDERNAMLNYKTGVCYLNSRSQKHRAVPYLERAAGMSASGPGGKRENAGVPADAVRLLGDAYYHARQFAAAVKAYEKYRQALLESAGAEAVAASGVDHYLEMSRYGSELQQRTLIPLNGKSGKPCAAEMKSVDYTMTPSPDNTAMLYTFRIPHAEGEPGHDSQYFEAFPGPPKGTDTLPAKKIAAKPAKSRLIESDTLLYSGTVGTSVDGHVVLTYRPEEGNASVSISQLHANQWSPPLKIGKPLNRGGWEPHEWVSADGCILLFASDRPGGYGGKDLYRCERQADGKWGKAVNLGEPINGPSDDVAPFIHPDGKTLYFSSNRVKSGNFDIFSCRLEPSDWGKLVNVGYPVNRSDKDIFQVTADKGKLYPSANKIPPGAERDKDKGDNKDGKRGKKTDADTRANAGDNFIVTVNDQYMKPMTFMRGRVLAEDGKTPLKAVITVLDNQSSKTIATYYSDEATGDYAFALPPGTDCQLRFEVPGRLTATEHALSKNDSGYYANRPPVVLPQLKEGAVLRLANVFFKDDLSGLTAASGLELQNLKKLMAEHPYLKGEVACTVYSADSRKNSRKTATQKASLVASALYAEGIARQRLTAKGYSKSPPAEAKKKNGKDLKPARQAPAVPPETLEFRIRKLK